MAEPLAFSSEPDDRLMCGSADCEATLSCLAPRSGCRLAPTPPQDATVAGDGDTTTSRPADASLAALDAAEARLIEAAREASRLFDITAVRQAPEWWFAIGRVMEFASQVEVAQ